MKNVMKRAWEIAKEGAKKFGGKAIEYIAEALKIAWKEVKKMTNELVKLVGSEKQVKWAEDIRKKFFDQVEKVKETMKKDNVFEYIFEDITENEFFKVAEIMKKEEKAKVWIDYRQGTIFERVEALKAKYQKEGLI